MPPRAGGRVSCTRLGFEHFLQSLAEEIEGQHGDGDGRARNRSEERRVGKGRSDPRWTGDWSSDVCSSDLRGSNKRATRRMCPPFVEADASRALTGNNATESRRQSFMHASWVRALPAIPGRGD